MVEDQGRYDDAERLYREALEIDREGVGEGHPSYAKHLNNLAGVLMNQDRPEEARALLQQALEIFRATLPPRSSEYSECGKRSRQSPLIHAPPVPSLTRDLAAGHEAPGHARDAAGQNVRNPRTFCTLPHRAPS